MKKDDLKETLRPLIKQCIKEVIFEEGILSGIISEVVKGIGSPSAVMMESPAESKMADGPSTQQVAELRETHQREMKSQRNKLNEAISERFGGVDLFEGTTPISSAGTAGQPSAPQSPLQGVSPEDPGVDLSRLGIFGK